MTRTMQNKKFTNHNSASSAPPRLCVSLFILHSCNSCNSLILFFPFLPPRRVRLAKANLRLLYVMEFSVRRNVLHLFIYTP
jgi:hypothetical protein